VPRKSSTVSGTSRKSTKSSKSHIGHGVIALTALIALIALVVGLGFAYIKLSVEPNLPSLDALTDYRPKIPLRVYTADNVLIGEFGEERRDFVPIAEMPAVMKNAIIAVEDDRFYSHSGVNFTGIIRAALANLRNSRSQGASTITMQVARNFLLTRQKTYSRKLQEILLAYKIEDKLSKDQILELYMNQIYLGERAYGFGTAARVYFGKSVKDLTIAEAAMLAGLPKAPATANPVVNPKRAKERQLHVLKRMQELNYITPAQYQEAAQEKLKVLSRSQQFSTHAEYAAETVRQFMYAQYKDDVYTSGFTVYTTLTKADQDAAYAAVRQGILNYERRHGYRGPEAYVDLSGDEDDRQQAIDEALLKHPDSGDLRSAIVLSASPRLVRAQLLSGDVVELAGEGLRFASSSLSARAAAAKKIRQGAVIRVIQDSKGRWSITQLPEVSAALVALNSHDGTIRALVGGFDFRQNQFDHASQAWRQPGSTIKPFIYSAALEKGFSPSTIINDAPLSSDDNGNSNSSWNPSNDDGVYDGPITMRTALKKSKNLVSIRILRSITPPYAKDYIGRFGLDSNKQPSNLTMALGTGSVTPMQMAGAYAVFANGGYQVAPHLIQKVVDGHGNVIAEMKGPVAGDENARVIDPRNAFIMDSMLHDVVRSGTGYMATQKLGRSDLAGKTGTTSDAMDGWFAGYGSDIVAVAWMGYDEPKSLGGREFGATLALPIWIDYMRVALHGRPETPRPVPNGLVQADGDWSYQEYLDKGAVRTVDVDVDKQKSFWDRFFNSLPGGNSTPAAGSQKQQQDQQQKKEFDEMYRG
jgi:penicillin-binding protein 1A